MIERYHYDAASGDRVYDKVRHHLGRHFITYLLLTITSAKTWETLFFLKSGNIKMTCASAAITGVGLMTALFSAKREVEARRMIAPVRKNLESIKGEKLAFNCDA